MSAQVAEPTSTPPRLELVATARRPADLEPAANEWQHAFDAEQHALGAVADILRPDDLARRRQALVEERRETAHALAGLARTVGVRPPWLVDQPLGARDLGLATGIAACIFDLDGVLTDSGRLHAS